MTPDEEAKAQELAEQFVSSSYDGPDFYGDADRVARALLDMRDQRDEARAEREADDLRWRERLAQEVIEAQRKAICRRLVELEAHVAKLERVIIAIADLKKPLANDSKR